MLLVEPFSCPIGESVAEYGPEQVVGFVLEATGQEACTVKDDWFSMLVVTTNSGR